MVISANLNLRQFGTRRASTAYAGMIKCRCKGAALLTYVTIPHESRQHVQCGTNKTVSWRIGRQLFETTIHLAFR